jgi:hypothetical protein
LGSNDPITKRTLAVYEYNTGINRNDAPLMHEFPFVQAPFPGNGPKACIECQDNDQSKSTPSAMRSSTNNVKESMAMATPEMMLSTQNPVIENNTIRYHVATAARVQIAVFDISGKLLQVLVDKQHEAGTYNVQWNTSTISKGTYLIAANKDGKAAKTVQVIKN